MAAYERKMEEKLSPEILEEFLAYLLSRGRSQVSLQEYRRTLTIFWDCLSEDKVVTAESGFRWKQWLEEKGFSPRTINTRISVWNSLAQYLGHRDWQVGEFSDIGGRVQPELTRQEYLRLLSAAKEMGEERIYLLIKAMGGMGLRMQELSQLTAEAVRQGSVRLERQNGMSVRVLHLPAILQREMMEYMSREGITRGPVFTTAGGKPMDRSNIGHSIKRVSRDARVAEEKVNPRCLWKMYRSTQQEIQANVAVLIEQAYERMLEQEQLVVGWEYN